MITLHLFDATHIALRNCYEHKAAIKALADWPDVRFDGESRQWLLHVALLDKLYFCLGDAIAPASPAFWCECPLYEPAKAQPRRRSKREMLADKRQQQAAAGRFGRIVVDAMHREVR